MYNYLFNTGTVVYAEGRIKGKKMVQPYKYAVIDVTSYFEEGWPEDLIAQAEADAKSRGIKVVMSLKEACSFEYGTWRRWVTDGQKNLFRGTHAPDAVYLIDYGDSNKVSTAKWLWSQNCDNIKLIARYPGLVEESFYRDDETSTLYYDETTPYLQKIRSIAATWAPALGYQFSAPLYRTERPDLNSMCSFKRDSEDKHTYRPYSDTTYRKAHEVVSKKELLEFYRYYLTARRAGLIEELLDQDYSICPECGKPLYHNRAEEVSFCACGKFRRLNAFLEVAYYDDNSKYQPEEDVWYYED